jgi:hypothetical protein
MTEHCHVCYYGTEWYTAYVIFSTFGASELYPIQSPDCALVTTVISHDTIHYKLMLQHSTSASAMLLRKEKSPSFVRKLTAWHAQKYIKSLLPV